MKTTHNVPLKALCLTLGVHFTFDRRPKVRLSEKKTKFYLSFLEREYLRSLDQR